MQQLPSGEAGLNLLLPLINIHISVCALLSIPLGHMALTTLTTKEAKQKLVKGSGGQFALPTALVQCPEEADGWKEHEEPDCNLCRMKKEMYSDSDDSDSEYYTAGSDDSSDSSEVVDGDMSDNSDSEVTESDEDDALCDGESTDESDKVTTCDSDTSDGDESDLEVTDGSDIFDEGQTTDESDSPDGSSSGVNSEESDDENVRLKASSSKEHQCGDDLASKLAKLKLERDYGRSRQDMHTAHCMKKGCSDANIVKSKTTDKSVGNVDFSFVYIMTDNRKRFKVGRSKDPWCRLRQLRTGNVDLKLLDCFKVSSIRAETAAHRALRMRCHRTREWFYGAYGDIKTIVSGAICAYLV